MNLRVMGNHILVLLAPDVTTTSSGLVELAPALTSVVTQGRVVRVGPKVTELQPGHMVAFPPEAGTPMVIGEHACLFLRESDVTAIVPPREVVSA